MHRHIAHVRLSFRNIAREGITQLEVLRQDNVLVANIAYLDYVPGIGNGIT